MRYLFGFLCVCALGLMPLVGCSETAGDGGSGGTGGTCHPQVGCPDDGDLCTYDECIDGMCVYVPEDCDDRNDCTEGDGCNPADGECTIPTPVANGTECAGGTCQDGVCELAGSVLPCSEQGIRNAIAAGGDEPYRFDCGGPTRVVTEAEIAIDNDVILDGEGNLIADGNNHPILEHTVFNVFEGVTAELRGFSLVGGSIGISNAGMLGLTNCMVSGNTGGITNGYFNIDQASGVPGTMTLTNSTVSGNGGDGGILSMFGTLMLTNSTVSGNTGDGVANLATLTLMNSTVSGNTGNGISSMGPDSTTSLANSLVDDECDGDIVSNGYNIESPGDTCGFDHGTDLVNITEGQVDLGELANNGGPTMTHALGADSVAIDHIPAVDCGVTTDQRGEPRPVGEGCDVGSFERQPEDP
jgi:hypothetical protein